MQILCEIQERLSKASAYLRTYGVWAFVKKVLRKVLGKDRPVNYNKWIKRHLPDLAELEKQRKTCFPYSPKVSIVVPLFCTPEIYLREMVISVKNQTYQNWELILSDGSGPQAPLKSVLQELGKSDSRIRVLHHDMQLHISENTNRAMKNASGEFVAFLDHDDVLTEHALYECVKLLNEDSELDLIYSDEDKMTMNGKQFYQPHFKPDFNLDLLRTVNYICHFTMVRKELIDTVGMLRAEYDGAQDYDFILRCVDKSRKIGHVSKVLYHWRCHKTSTAENPESKQYAFEAGKRALEAHYERNDIQAKVYYGEYPGLYRTRYCWEEKPLVSIVIPNKNHVSDLKKCIDSIDEKSNYGNYEYVIVENNSTEEETFRYYKELEKKKNVTVVYYDGSFNYSAINNYGIQYAKGDYLLLLNNDTEIVNGEVIPELLGYCMRPDVGIVGARLYFEDDTIQHAGVVIGFGGIAGHCFVQQPRSSTGYCHRIICAQNYSAVTAACMMVKKEAFEKAGGLSLELAVAFNDIDFCMKVREAGYLIVYNPYAELYHYESKSRGLEDTPEKKARFEREIAIFKEKWQNVFDEGDPYYNSNLSLETQDFSLKKDVKSLCP